MPQLAGGYSTIDRAVAQSSSVVLNGTLPPKAQTDCAARSTVQRCCTHERINVPGWDERHIIQFGSDLRNSKPHAKSGNPCHVEPCNTAALRGSFGGDRLDAASLRRSDRRVSSTGSGPGCRSGALSGVGYMVRTPTPRLPTRTFPSGFRGTGHSRSVFLYCWQVSYGNSLWRIRNKVK